MKRLYIVIFLACAHALLLWSQESQITQDPAAERVLERMASKTRSLKSMQADFTMVIEDRKEKLKSSSSGSFIIKQNKYVISADGSTVYFNGNTMWTYISASNEVTITEPERQAEDFLSNPAAFFSLYKRDFKYRYVRETNVNGIKCHEIDLFPRNLDQPYSRIKVCINVSSDLPEVITSVGKDGVDYTVRIRNLVLDREIEDHTFTFDPSKYRKLEIVDMRGIK